MSARTIPIKPLATRRRSLVAFRRRRRRRMTATLGVALLAVLLAGVVIPRLPDAVRELALPLSHEDIIRQQATAKELDPSLLAAVIYAESRFRDATSHAGARGLMQITPDTARYIAQLSGGTKFEQGDLSTPQINISYGAFYLRYLLKRYGGNTVLALAAYNGGEGNVDRWIVEASVDQRAFVIDRIPFAETREYVGRVLDARRQYREKYSRELGL
ncbi:MAG TPA: lytic transglycosylase domain-containing protein [Solirubrobacteraceae bacterium]|nr:lytic transglycosylase domain-containing protein [Solirubrobacteraceae bacterium]